jgi:hypothetical protein
MIFSKSSTEPDSDSEGLELLEDELDEERDESCGAAGA